MNKKQVGMVALMIVAMVSLSHAQSFFPALRNISDVERERLDKVYTISLNSDNNGVVEAALTVVTMIKLDAPGEEFPMIRDQIEYLASHSEKPIIRYKASLAGAVFDNPEKYRAEYTNRFNDSDDFFSSLDNASSKPSLSSK